MSTEKHIFPGDPLPAIVQGDIWLLHGGEYTGAYVVGSTPLETANITIQNAPGERVVFRNPAPPPGLSSSPYSIVLYNKGITLQENPLGGELKIDHTVGAGGIGFAISADDCHVKNIRTRGCWLNTRARVKRGSARGLVLTRSGKDDPLIDANRGSGYCLYAQNDGTTEFLMTDLLCAMGYSSMLHLFGGAFGARWMTLRNIIAVGAASLSLMPAAKAAIVINEENSQADAQFDDILIDDAVIGSPYLYINGQPYPNPGGMASQPLQLGGPETHINGRVTLNNVTLLGRPNAAEKCYVRAKNSRVIYRPGSGVENGWAGKANLLPGPGEALQEFQCVGWPDSLPNLAPQVKVYPNPSEGGRYHVSVEAYKNERSVDVVIPGLERGKTYAAWEACRETTQEFTAKASNTVTLSLPDISPAGVQQGRDLHPILFEFLVRRV